MPASGLAASGNAIYAVANGPIDPYVTVERMDSAFDTAKRVARVATVIGGDAGSLVATRRGRLLVTPSSGLMTWVDPRSGRATALADPSATSVAAAQGFGSSWLVEADWECGRARGSEWNTDCDSGRPGAERDRDRREQGVGRQQARRPVKSIDPATNSIDDVVSVAGAPSGIALSGTTLWVASSETGTLTRIDASTGRVTGPAVQIGGSPQSLVVADGKVWVTVQRRELPATVKVGGTVVVNRPSPNAPMNLDPALVNIPNANLILYSTCLELLNYPDQPGAAGTRLVPDAARALPSLSRDRRTLTFVIRTGMRFSPPSNQVVTAATFRNSIERSLDRRLVAKGEDPPALGYLVGCRRRARILGREGSPRHGHHRARQHVDDPAAASRAADAGAPLDGVFLRAADERPAHASHRLAGSRLPGRTSSRPAHRARASCSSATPTITAAARTLSARSSSASA